MPRGFKNAVPMTAAEEAAQNAIDSAPGANAPIPAEPVTLTDEAGRDVTPVSDALIEANPVESDPAPVSETEDAEAQPESADEVQAPFELVDSIPQVRQPKTKYADAISFLHAHPGQAIKVPLVGKTSAVGAAQTIRRNFPEVTVTTRTDPATQLATCYAVFNPTAEAATAE